MTKLATEMCAACDTSADSLSLTEQQELLKQLPGWRICQPDGVKQLVKSYPFKDFNMALDFANAVGELAEGANHHPAIMVEWGQTTITWWTHTINGLHRNDFIMAAKTDYLHGK